MSFNPILFYESGKARQLFISTWNTANTSTGSSTSTQVRLPLISVGTYNFTVDWGDGSSDTITVWNAAATTHTYSSSGTYTIKIKGTCTGWQFNNTGDRLKFLSVASWGKLRLGTTQGQWFNGCANLTLASVSDILDLTGVTSALFMFGNCTSLTTINRINEWNISAITSLRGMFASAINFNSNIGAWDVSNITTFESMFASATNFNNGGSADINNWQIRTTGTVSMSGMFSSATAFNQPIGSWNTSAVTTMGNMFSNATAFNQNIGSWNVSSVGSFLSMFQNATNFNNGGSADINNWSIKTTGTVSMNQMFRLSPFNQPIGSWNTSAVTDMSGMFRNATVFNQNISSWNVSAVTTMDLMFNVATNFNQPIGNWERSTPGNTSTLANVTTLVNMFATATNFNNGLASGVAGTLSWNTSAVTNMNAVFSIATAFNQNIGSWNVSAVTNMNAMFQSATNFNQNIGSWNVSNVTSFVSMFNSATNFNNGGSADINNWQIRTTGTVSMSSMFVSATAFNQPIGNWNVSAVNGMQSMFFGASAFNQNIGTWERSTVGNVSTLANVTTMDTMFRNATVFNNGLASGVVGTLAWTTSAVTAMSNMFRSAPAFNQNIGSWNVSNVTTFNQMFNGATNFNNGGSADINNWTIKTTGNVDMGIMFQSTNFNQPIGNWNTSAVTAMNSMFNSSPAFNQNIGSWDVRNVTTFVSFMAGKTALTLSTTNLNAIYNGWSTRPVQPNIVINFGSAKYTAASSAGRLILTTAPNLWSITDGGI